MRRRALGLLARREHSVAELRSKLASGEGEGAVAAVLDALALEGLLSDRRFAEVFIRSRRERGSGPLRIQADLRQRGISGELMDELLDIADADWRSVAKEARRKRFGTAQPSNFPERAQQARFLRARGFTEDQVRSALRDDSLE